MYSPPDYFAAMSRARRLQSEAFWRLMGLAVRALKRLALRAARSVRARHARRRAIRDLMAMDECSLRDLGLNRAYAPYVVDYGGEAPPPANTIIGPVKTDSAA